MYNNVEKYSSHPGGHVCPTYVVAGYWHNWGVPTDIPAYIPLRNIDARYNVIHIAFANTGSDFATLNFVPAIGSVAAFQADVQFLQAQGKKVLLSIGGEEGALVLTSAAQKQAFINSLEDLLDLYNFDGFDLDLEGRMTLQLDIGDNNFMSPTTPRVINLIAAVREVISYRQGKGKSCWLTMTPETFYVQKAYANAYSPLAGAYLPIIYSLRDQLTFLQPQFYNAGSVTALDGKRYVQAIPDFTVAMTEMLLTGFPVTGLKGDTQVFPALRPDQVIPGLPAVPAAAPFGGYYDPADVRQALNYLTKGQTFGGDYNLRNPAGYPGLRGAMTWSINWDQSCGNTFAANIYNFFCESTSATHF
ncbi:MAG TPA: chitinase [Puia sp.]|nr:chitinase [Puia sp.]